MKKRKVSLDQELEVAQKYLEGATSKEIANMFNVSAPTILEVLRRQGVTIRPSRSEFYKITSEMVEQAILRYQNGELLSDIAKEYGVTYANLAYHLQNRGIAKYPNGYQMRSFKPMVDEEIGQRYEAGENLPELTRVYGPNKMAIRKAIMRTGRQMRSKKVALKKYGLKEDAFRELTSAAMYWIGFIMADGCITDRKDNKQSYVLAIDLHRKDRNHLAKFISFLSYDGPISDYKNRFMSGVKIVSDSLVYDLMKFGVSVRKSLNEQPCDALIDSIDYWRGEVDGDGSIWMDGYMPAMSLIGGEYLITKFENFVKSFTSTKASPSHKGNGLWSLALKCGPAIDTIKTLYGNCDPACALDRKLERAKRILECWPSGYDGVVDHALW